MGSEMCIRDSIVSVGSDKNIRLTTASSISFIVATLDKKHNEAAVAQQAAVQYARGLLYARAKDHPQALEQYISAITLQPFRTCFTRPIRISSGFGDGVTPPAFKNRPQCSKCRITRIRQRHPNAKHRYRTSL